MEWRDGQGYCCTNAARRQASPDHAGACAGKKSLFLSRPGEKLRPIGTHPLDQKMIREREPDLRRHPRAKVAWPVTVSAGDQRLDLLTMNLSPFGAKVRLDEPVFELGTPAQLHFSPPGGRPLDVHAIVWRTDPDGSAFFFIGIAGDDFSFPTESSPSHPPKD